MAFAYVERAKGASDARAKATSDSLAIITAALRVQVDSALVHQRADSAAEVQRLKAIRARDAQVVGATRPADSLASLLRLGLPDTLRGRVDSLQRATGAAIAILTQQRESAIVLFTHAAAQRDTLADLLRRSQAQLAGVSGALAQASCKPLWELPGVKIIEGALAVYGAARLLGR